MQHLGGPADHNEVGVGGPRAVGQGVRWITEFPDEGQMNTEFACSQRRFAGQFGGDLGSDLTGGGMVERRTNCGRSLYRG